MRRLVIDRLTPSVRVNRLQQAMHRCRRRGRAGRVAALWLHYRLARNWGCYIHPEAELAEPRYGHPTGIVIGQGVIVDPGVTIYQHVTLGASRVNGTGYPTIRAGAVLYAGATVLGDIEVGRGAVVGAGALVLADVPDRATVVGQPARVVS